MNISREKSMTNLGKVEVKRRTGDEKFHIDSQSLGFDLLSFWQWSSSDVVSNALRGILAEYIVAQALGVADNTIREEWSSFDIKAQDGTRIEVKSAAYIQSWHQDRLSKITFNVPKTLAWESETNRMSNEARRQAEVYVFAIQSHTDQPTLDVLNMAQWEFYVLPTIVLDRRTRSQHSITLPSLRQLTCDRSVGYSQLKAAIEDAARIQRESV